MNGAFSFIAFLCLHGSSFFWIYSKEIILWGLKLHMCTLWSISCRVILSSNAKVTWWSVTLHFSPHVFYDKIDYYTPVNHHSSVKIEKNVHLWLFQFFYRGREWGREQGSGPWASSSEALHSRHPLFLQNLNSVAVLTSFSVFSLKRFVISSHVYSPSRSSDNSASTVSSASVNTLGLPDLGSAAAFRTK